MNQMMATPEADEEGPMYVHRSRGPKEIWFLEAKMNHPVIQRG
jgi:hypothetical protein